MQVRIFPDADHCIDFRYILLQLFLITLCQTADNDQLSAFVLFIFRHLKNRLNGLFLCGIDESARIDNDCLCLIRIVDKLMAAAIDHTHHFFTVYQIFAAA